MNESSIARDIATRWGLAGSTNLVLWGLLAVLVALLLGIAGGWWVGDSIQEGEQAKAAVTVANQDNDALAKSLKDAHETVVAQQRAVASASANLEAATKRLQQINLETAREREENRRQMGLLRDQVNAALAARPDLRDVHVGSGVLDAWNAANRGRADAQPPAGAAGAAQPPEGRGPRQSGAVPAGASGGKGR